MTEAIVQQIAPALKELLFHKSELRRIGLLFYGVPGDPRNPGLLVGMDEHLRANGFN